MSMQVTYYDAQYSRDTAHFRQGNRLLRIQNIGYNVPPAVFEHACREKLADGMQSPEMQFFWQAADRRPRHNRHRGRVEVGFDNREALIRAETELRGWIFRGRLLRINVALNRCTWEDNVSAASPAASSARHYSGSNAAFFDASVNEVSDAVAAAAAAPAAALAADADTATNADDVDDESQGGAVERWCWSSGEEEPEF